MPWLGTHFKGEPTRELMRRVNCLWGSRFFLKVWHLSNLYLPQTNFKISPAILFLHLQSLLRSTTIYGGTTAGGNHHQNRWLRMLVTSSYMEFEKTKIIGASFPYLLSKFCISAEEEREREDTCRQIAGMRKCFPWWQVSKTKKSGEWKFLLNWGARRRKFCWNLAGELPAKMMVVEHQARYRKMVEMRKR